MVGPLISFVHVLMYLNTSKHAAYDIYKYYLDTELGQSY